MRRGTPSVHVISNTPFDQDGNIDYDNARAHFRRLKEAGVGVYVAGGGSGEAHTMSNAEIGQLLSVAVDELKGTVPVRAMLVEPRTAKQMIEMVGIAADAGVDATQIYSLDMGHGGIARPPVIERYLRDVLEVCPIPSVISTHMSVGYLVPVDLLAELCEEYDSIIGINCSTHDFPYLVRLLDQVDQRVEVHVGGPMYALSALALGGTGFLSGEGNVAPKLAQSLIDSYRAGDYPGAEEAYTKINRLFAMMMMGTDGKSLLRSMGLPGGFHRPPRLGTPDEQTVLAARKRLAEIGIPELAPYLGEEASIGRRSTT
jgi:4-hydroxy-tetrahydrodipicolinate synthase